MSDTPNHDQRLVGYWPNTDCRFLFGQMVQRAIRDPSEVAQVGAVVGWDDEGLCWVRWSAGFAVAQLEDVDELIAWE